MCVLDYCDLLDAFYIEVTLVMLRYIPLLYQSIFFYGINIRYLLYRGAFHFVTLTLSYFGSVRSVVMDE
jgi:hypothetical protein